MNHTTFWKRMFFSFVLIQAGITLAMGIIGCAMRKDAVVPYVAFFFPFLFAALCMIPQILFYTEKELTIRQTLVRRIIELALLEVIVLGGQKVLAPSTSFILFVCIGISVAGIAAIVQLIGWLYGKGEADQMNQKLQEHRRKQTE